MPRPPRVLTPDLAFHVTNRALGRRPAFEADVDRRFFLSLLAKAVRRHSLRVLAYSLLGTHFHLFARSETGSLANAMQVVLGDYTRGFNAHRDRPGPLWQTRYFARPVRSDRYGLNVVRYLDFNPVLAGLCRTPCEYPFGSAYHYAKPEGPPWLDRQWIEQWVSGGPGFAYDPSLYPAFIGGADAAAAFRLVEERLAHDADGIDPLDDLLAGGHDRLRAWMLANAMHADGVPPHVPVVDRATVLEVVRAARRLEPDWTARAGARRTGAWRIAVVALLRDLCALRDSHIGATLDLGRAQVHRARAAHAILLSKDPAYAARLSELAAAALAACHPKIQVCGIVPGTD